MEECCYMFKLDVSCIILAILNIVFSLFTTAAAIVVLKWDYDHSVFNHNIDHILSFLGIEKSLLVPIMVTAAVMGILLIVFSILLIYGVRAGKPGCILAYFSFGLYLAITLLLGSLLELLHSDWGIALLQFLFTMLYIYTLIVVHTLYDHQKQGDYRRSSRDIDEAFLITSDDT